MKLITELKQINDDSGEIEITDGLTFNQRAKLRMIELYSSSTYENGNYYPNQREIPFYNIVNTMVDTAVVATDIDTKDIRVEAEDAKDYDKSFIYNHEIQKWMKESDFAQKLNEMGEVRARYGGVLVKKCIEKDEETGEKELEIEVPEWKNLITDPQDILGGVIIEKHYLTPSQLRKKSDVWSNTDEAISMYGKKGYTRSDARIEVWEVHGEFSNSYLAEDAEFNEEEKEYSKQVHYYAVKGDKYEHLYWAEEKELPYKYLAWKKVAGRALGRGVVEEGEQAQVWTNDDVQKRQMAMELASKTIITTDDPKFGNNVTTEVDNGQVMQLQNGRTANVLNLLNPSVISELRENIDSWWSQYERTTSSYDAVRGETPPSGQPYRLQSLVAQQGGSHFDYRREEWGIFLTEIFNDWVFPYIEKKLNKKHLLASDFTPEELMRLDEQYALYSANQEAKDRILNGDIVTQEDYMGWQEQFKQLVGGSGKRRFLDIPEDYYKDMDARLTINVTGEQKNKMAALESLNSMLQSILPMVQAGIMQPQDVSLVFNKIMELSGAGISPLSLTKANTQAQQPTMQPSQAMPQATQPQGQVGLQAINQ